MGNDDRDYMRGDQAPSGKLRRIPSRKPDDPTPRQLLVAVGQMIITFIGIIFSLRWPTPGILKLAIVVILLVLGARWIIRTYRRS
ncbi:MAG: hypothetical protein ACI9R3_002936 [Verrucomicrobiales bacterium]|jgi:hypothetical protein